MPDQRPTRTPRRAAAAGRRGRRRHRGPSRSAAIDWLLVAASLAVLIGGLVERGSPAAAPAEPATLAAPTAHALLTSATHARSLWPSGASLDWLERFWDSDWGDSPGFWETETGGLELRADRTRFRTPTIGHPAPHDGGTGRNPPARLGEQARAPPA